MVYFKIIRRLITILFNTNTTGSLVLIIVFFFLFTNSVFAQDLDKGFETEISVEGTLKETAERQNDGMLAGYRTWKQQIKVKTGLDFGFDNNMQYLGTNTDNIPSDAMSNVFRFYSTWTAIGRGTPNDGALIFKIESRSAIGNYISTQALGPTLGYAGVFSSTYSDAGLVLTNLFWRQRLANGKLSFVLGHVDTYDYVNVNSVSSPWTAFTNLAFEQQPTFAGPSQGLGAALLWRLNNNWAVLGGIANANGNASEPLKSAEKLFQSGETFKHIAFGWSPNWGDRYDQLIQLTFWQIDKREEAGIDGGHGISFTTSGRFYNFRPFFRAGFAKDAGVMLKRAISIGTGYEVRGGKDLAGLAIGWGRLPDNPRKQFTLEGFYRYDMTNYLQITPEIQYVSKPANNIEIDHIIIFGGRLRIFF